jgi:flagellar hook-length control protein FliK
MAFNALPAQLMQFSGREFELKPYSGLQFSELTARLLEQATTARSQGDGTYQATLDLNPPSLGRISVNISVRGDSVALQLAVASTAPREQLKGNLAALQRSLEEAGLHVVELKVVTVDPDGRPARQYREQQDQPQPTEAADDDALRLAFRQELSMSNV